MLDGTESLPLLVHSVCRSAQTEERQKESLSAAHLLSLGRRVSFRGHTVAAIPAVIPFGTCLDCSQRIANIIIINSLHCSMEDLARDLICAQRKRNKRWPVSQRDLHLGKPHRRACP